MKKIVKIGIVALLAILFQPSTAQTFGIKGGLNMSTMLEMDAQYVYSNNYSLKPGFHVGMTLDLPFNEYFSFEPALLFTSKGTKYEINESGTVLSGKANLYYIEMPLNFKLGFKMDRRGKNKIFFAAGPYLGYGIIGQLQTSLDVNGQSKSGSESVSWGSDAEENNFKNFDYGMSFGAGFEFSSIAIGVSYEYGMANISAYQENGLIAQNRVLMFSFGYLFKGNSRGGYNMGGYNRRRK